MHDAVLHPSPQELTAFALGKLPEHAAAAVAAHLESCPICRQAVAAVPADSFLDKVRAVKQDGSSFPPGSAQPDSAPHRAGKPATPDAPCLDLPPELAHHPRYFILRQLGRGGMGVVYLARHLEMDRTVVIKVINHALLERPDSLERFRREIRAAAQLSHPNIVTAYDAEQAGETHILVMEFVPGHSLAEVVRLKGPLPVGIACNFARQIAVGLQHAYEHNMVHRDIKPQNLMLTPKGQIKILDFGLAKVVSERNTETGLTETGAYMGTPDYCAPEQAEDARTADIRADLYGLGCTLYCLLAGHPPFQEDTAMKIYLAHREKQPQPLPELRKDVPAELWQVVERLLAKDPAQRYQKPNEVFQALIAFVKPGVKPDAKNNSAPAPGVGSPVKETKLAADTNEIKKVLQEVPGKTPPKKALPEEEASPFADLVDTPAILKKTKRAPVVWYRRWPVSTGVALTALVLVGGLFMQARRNQMEPNDEARIAENQPDRSLPNSEKSSVEDATKEESQDEARKKESILRPLDKSSKKEAPKENQPVESQQKNNKDLRGPALDKRPRGQQEIVHFHTVDHMELAGTLYHGWKSKQGMTVLMLHDLGRDRSSPGWKHLAEALQAEGHTVLTFDFRGHGDSKKVSANFWNYSVNKYLPIHETELPAAKQPAMLKSSDLPREYLPWLIEDIAAARTYLDVRHDEPDGPINTFNLIVIGADQAAALGSLWMGTEGVRYNGADVSGKTVLKPSEKLSILQTVWLGMADPLKISPFGVHSWLQAAHVKPVVPITFVYGENDTDTSNLLSLPIREKYGAKIVIPGANQSGQQLLDMDARAAEQIKQYLVKTLHELQSQPGVPRRIKSLLSYWAIPQHLPGGKEQMRIYVAKRVGEETLTPVPLLPLGIRIKGLAEPQPLPSVPDDTAKSQENSKREKPTSTETTSSVARMAAADLAKATGSRFKLLLHNYRIGKGSEYTEALGLAIPQLSGDSQQKAREALAERLARMKDTTLEKYLSDEMLEIRIAAARACAIKGSKSLIPNLIPLLRDTRDGVAEAGHQALKELSGQDFGPQTNASGEARVQASHQWTEWWNKQKVK
jgi:serine/threonine protein kinase/pimeloyl-ACP methyl ester carboxylesterase